jgi:hypothetical protein
MGFVDNLSGKTAARAAVKGADIQAGALEDSKGILNDGTDLARTALSNSFGQTNGSLAGFAGLGDQALAQSNLLLDPNAQNEFIQNNPMYQQAIQNAIAQTQKGANASGSSGTGQFAVDLANATANTGLGFLQNQQNNINNALSTGFNATNAQNDLLLNEGSSLANLELGNATNMANLVQGIGAVQAGGITGAANARTAGASGLFNAAAQLGGAALGNTALMSDKRLKDNIKNIGKMGKFNKYSWTWNEIAAKEFGLTGSDTGVIAQEVEETNPEFIVTHENGYKMVNYEEIV